VVLVLISLPSTRKSPVNPLESFAGEASQSPDRKLASTDEVDTASSSGEEQQRINAGRVGKYKDSPGVFAQFPVQFGRYEVRSCLGGGGMGEVYLAWDQNLGRSVALKVPKGYTRPNLLRRFYREARCAAALDHPAICPIYDYGELEGVCFLTLKYIEGRTLADVLDEGPLPISESIELCRKLAEGLEAAHRAGVIHRDLKPDNIMLDRGGRPYIMDFGLAHHDGDDHVTRDGDIMGTPAYMSPEQARGETNQLDARTDVYSLGAILYQTLTGSPPFTGNFAQVLSQVLHEQPTPITRLRAGIDPRLEEVCTRAMSKTTVDRYATAEEFAAVLGELGPSPTIDLDVGRSSAPRTRLASPMLAMAVLVVLAVGAVLRSGSQPSAKGISSPDEAAESPIGVSEAPKDRESVDPRLVDAIDRLADDVSSFLKEKEQAPLAKLNHGAIQLVQTKAPPNLAPTVERLLTEELATRIGPTRRFGNKFSWEAQLRFVEDQQQVTIRLTLFEDRPIRRSLKRKDFLQQIDSVAAVELLLAREPPTDDRQESQEALVTQRKSP
jgi:serine/threonine protein kinase